MHIVSFREPVYSQFSKSSGVFHTVFEPFKPFVVSNFQYTKMTEDKKNKEVIYRASMLEPRLPNFVANNDPQNGSLLFWTGAGGFGDQIMAWPVAHILHTMGYKVHVMTDPGHMTCWWGFDWARSVFQFPIYYETFKMFDHHCVFETITNADEHTDQLHPVDSMLNKIGVKYSQVDASLKVMRPSFTTGEFKMAQLQRGARKIGFYQLSSAGKTRALSPEASAAILGALAAAYPDISWVALYDSFTDNEYRMKAELLNQPNVKVVFFQNIRELWALTSQAAIVVGPDSMMVHVAGSMGVPCVGLWGAVDPKTRVVYYRNHIALWKSEKCPSCPCYHHFNNFPDFCPGKEKEQCLPLVEIRPEEVVNAAKALLG